MTDIETQRPRVTDRLSALSGLLSPIVLAATSLWVAAQRPEYSPVGQALSELGAVGRPYATLMNLAGIVPAGLLTAAAAPAINRLFGARGLSRAGAVVLVLAGLGFVATSVFAWTGAASDLSSANNKLHLVFALSGFFCLALAPLLFALAVRTDRAARWRLVASLAAALLVFLFGFVLPRPPYLGLFQRAALAAFFAWLVSMSIAALRRA